MRKLETLFKEFINSPIQIYTGAEFVKGLNDLTQVYANTSSGDLVIVKGNHDIGNNSIQLKDGVNWEFKGNPTITSSSPNGTFDASLASVSNPITVHWGGDVKVRNTDNSAFIKHNEHVTIDGFEMKLILAYTTAGQGGGSGNDGIVVRRCDFGECSARLSVFPTLKIGLIGIKWLPSISAFKGDYQAIRSLFGSYRIALDFNRWEIKFTNYPDLTSNLKEETVEYEVTTIETSANWPDETNGQNLIFDQVPAAETLTVLEATYTIRKFNDSNSNLVDS